MYDPPQSFRNEGFWGALSEFLYQSQGNKGFLEQGIKVREEFKPWCIKKVMELFNQSIFHQLSWGGNFLKSSF